MQVDGVVAVDEALKNLLDRTVLVQYNTLMLLNCMNKNQLAKVVVRLSVQYSDVIII